MREAFFMPEFIASSGESTSLRLARHAMATRFELVLPGENVPSLRAAGEEALEEISRLEDRLSLYRPSSEIAHINARAAEAPVRVSAEVFHLLAQALQLGEAMEGAFDVTIGPLVRCWGFMGDSGAFPAENEVENARRLVGLRKVHLDANEFTVSFEQPGMMIDLGAIGKGYAIDQAILRLREAGVENALLHGGTSTVFAMGSPGAGKDWIVAIPHPTNADEILQSVALHDESLSLSAIWGRSFEHGNKTYGHVIDPRSGQPVNHALMSAVVLKSATETDALSTALLTLGPSQADLITKLRPEVRWLRASGDEQPIKILSHEM
jgi:thiamine biosynthesis lipoprotein